MQCFLFSNIPVSVWAGQLQLTMSLPPLFHSQRFRLSHTLSSYLKTCLRHLMLPSDLSFSTILLEVQHKYNTIGQNIKNTINLRIHIFVRCLLARHPPISKKRESKTNRVPSYNIKPISRGSQDKEFWNVFHL